MSDIVGALCILFSIIYFFAAGGWEGFQQSFKARDSSGRSMTGIDALATLGAVALGAIVLLFCMT